MTDQKHQGPNSPDDVLKDADGANSKCSPEGAGASEVSRREVLAAVPKVVATMALTTATGEANAVYNMLFFRAPQSRTLFGWGAQDSNGGRLGLGDIIRRSSPTQVGTLSTWVSAHNTRYFSLGLRTDGTIWGVGHNAQGQLGTNSTANVSSFVQIGALSTWTAINTGDSFGLGIQADGTMWAWGQNSSGTLGNNATVNRSNPVQVGTASNWKSMSADASALAIRADGTLWAWGTGASGELGNGQTTNRSAPLQVGTLSSWQQVGINWGTVIGLRTDGTMWAWGRDTGGSLGRNSSGVKYSSPVQIGSLSSWARISAAFVNGAAVRQDGTLWTWGDNSAGQLGVGNTTSRSNPIQVGTLSTWVDVNALSLWYSGTMTALRSDGTLWCWGNGNHIGHNSTVSYSSPIQVGSLSSWTGISTGWDATFAYR